MLTNCSNCKKRISIHGKKREKWKHHFCDRKCYTEYRHKHPEQYGSHIKKYNWSLQQKLNTFAEIRKNNTKT